jgi:hypothetical protein
MSFCPQARIFLRKAFGKPSPIGPSKKFRKSFEKVSKKFRKSFEKVSKKFRKSFEKVSEKFRENLRENLRKRFAIGNAGPAQGVVRVAAQAQSCVGRTFVL